MELIFRVVCPSNYDVDVLVLPNPNGSSPQTSYEQEAEGLI
jgi:hypothetical protein